MKANKDRAEQRMTALIELILEGHSTMDMLEIINGKGYVWNIGRRQFFNYLKQARKYLSNLSKLERDYELGLTKSRLNDLYCKSYQRKDYKTCLAISREFNSLYGLYEMDQVEVRLQEIEKQLLNKKRILK